jgi:hypothetical protein
MAAPQLRAAEAPVPEGACKSLTLAYDRHSSSGNEYHFDVPFDKISISQ